jgi:hypothetical protein
MSPQVLGLAPGSNEPRVTGNKYTGTGDTAEQPVFAQSGQRLTCVGEGERGQRDGDCHLAVTHDTVQPRRRKYNTNREVGILSTPRVVAYFVH